MTYPIPPVYDPLHPTLLMYDPLHPTHRVSKIHEWFWGDVYEWGKVS